MIVDEKIPNKKVGRRKKKKSFFVFLILFLFIFGVVCFFVIKKINSDTLNKIRKNYNTYVVVTKNTDIYDKNNKTIGKISKNVQLELVKIKNVSLDDKYFKIKDTDNYISYKDVKKIKKMSDGPTSSDYYVVFNKNVKSKKKISLYDDKKVIITLDNGINLPIQYMNEDNYYVKYINRILSVKKNKNIKVIDNNNTDVESASYVSVLYYDKIDDNCSGYDCFSKNSVQAQIDALKNNGYYFITKDDYKKYINEYLRIKSKAIFMTTSLENDIVNSINQESSTYISVINDEDGVKFQSTNKKSSPSDPKDKINRYQIKTYSTIDNILKMANGEDVVESEPVKVVNQGIAVLNYHFFYDDSQSCNEAICLHVSKFRSHLQYLKDNGYKTLTMKEFTDWMYGNIELPEKSVLITIDDGAMGTGKHNGNHLITLLEEYKMHATLFLIAGWWDISNYQSDYLEVQSHTYDMHQYGDCGRGQLVCADYETAKADIQKSLDIIKDNTSFCYPFYSYDDEAIRAVKDLGFKVAFIGGNVKAKRSNDKYRIPRYPIQSDITLQRFAEIVG